MCEHMRVRLQILVPFVLAASSSGCHTNDASFERVTTFDCNTDSPVEWSTQSLERDVSNGIAADSDEARVAVQFGGCNRSLRDDADIVLVTDACHTSVG